MMILDRALSWREVGEIAAGEGIRLSDGARERIRAARRIVDALSASNVRVYGINTGVGALCDVVIDAGKLRSLSRNIIMSHAVGVGPVLGAPETRAILAAAINNFARGHSGIRLEVVETLAALLNGDCLPEVPAGGSVGYLTHMAHVALVLLGEGAARVRGQPLSALDALRTIGVSPVVLEAKEGLSLVNGTPCATGLSAYALGRIERLLDWADAIAAMAFENLHGQIAAFDAEVLGLRSSPALAEVGARLRAILKGSEILDASAGRRTQDALSLRAIPHVHGAAREHFAFAAGVIDRELASATDNPLVAGTPAAPRAHSSAHAVGAAVGLCADSLGVALAEVAAMSERRIDRLVNPLVSGLAPFLAADGGAGSGLMIAQYTAVSLVAQNRRLAAPASLDGGVTSGLQEDHLCHATPAALKLLKIVDNAELVLAIEMLAAAQAYDLRPRGRTQAPGTRRLFDAIRARVPIYLDDRPLGVDIGSVAELMRRYESDEVTIP